MPDVDLILAAWRDHDVARALHPADRAIVEQTRAARALVVEHALAGAERDLFNACAVLGRLIAQQGGSPTMAVATVDGAVAAIGAAAATWAAPARAAVAEGFAAALAERLQAEARGRWEAPRCVVRVDGTTVAIAGGYPEDDGEALAAWAERVALQCGRLGARRAVIAGTEQAMAALADALGALGVEVLPAGGAGAPRPRSWLPWRR
jgi:hypothetical protein